MVYFGGLNSVYGSIVGAVSLSLLSEALRPLEIFKWIVIPLAADSGDDLPTDGSDRVQGIRCQETDPTEAEAGR